jgi:chemotaxis protein methyltransferase CheR
MTGEHLFKKNSNAASLVAGEFAFSAEDFRAISGLVKAVSGIDLPESKASLVYSRLTKRLRIAGLSTFRDYCKLVANDEAERTCMLSAITTNVTKFYRETHHFEDLQKAVLRPVAEAARRGERVRLWSAACSTGQEPYSMALALMSAIPDAPKLDIRILATDLNPNVVEHGRRGIYRLEEVEDVPSELRSRWFEPVVEEGQKMLRIAETVRSLVTFRELNLMEQWPMKGQFQAIFCRNVVIYFDQTTQAKLWQRFVKLLPVGGTLYIGHSERISGPAVSELMADGITTFRRRTGTVI